MQGKTDGLYAGWAQADLTPDRPVQLAGQFQLRISEGVRDPLTATALALESVREGESVSRAVLVSCDLVSIAEGLRNAVREHLARELPELDPRLVIIGATHSHTSMELRVAAGDVREAVLAQLPAEEGLESGAMTPQECEALAAERIAGAVAEAWRGRRPAAFGYGLGQAVVGRNRRATYYDGHSAMYGKTNDPEFSHIEGYEDHSLNVMGLWSREGKLTGLVVNLACPAQETGGDWEVSADFWHEAREELRRRLGSGLFILPQNSAAGDQSPTILVGRPAEARMWRLTGRNSREEIGVRIADGVTTVLPYMAQEQDSDPEMAHHVEDLPLPRRVMTEQDVAEAEAEAEKSRAEYQEHLADLQAHPEKRQEPRWYFALTYSYRRAAWWGSVKERFERQQIEPEIPYEIHVLRLGEIAIATNPFEYYVDYGMQIKTRSRAVQTFLVQHVGLGTYLPTLRAVAGGGYGALPASTVVGPEAGRKLSQWTVETINALFEE